MHDVAENQQSPIKEQLQIALASDRPASDLAAQVRVSAPGENWAACAG
jgi:hypothetical protein